MAVVDIGRKRPQAAPTWLRAAELPKAFPVFGATTWGKLLASGQVPSRRIGGARIVRTADVEAWLAGEVDHAR